MVMTDNKIKEAFYDKYSAAAYGLILKCVPDAAIASEILVELFRKPDLNEAAMLMPGAAAELLARARKAAGAWVKAHAGEWGSAGIPILEGKESDDGLFPAVYFGRYSLADLVDILNKDEPAVKRLLHLSFKQVNERQV
jgi:hypothetical protein